MNWVSKWCSASREAEKDYIKLKKAYLKAKEEGREQFVFVELDCDNWNVLTKFAYYMLQYIESWREARKLKIYKNKIGEVND
jgi:hypothetical protein